jgi:signal transduction histidine kinase
MTPWYRSLRVRIFLLIIWLGMGTIFILTTFFLNHERKALEVELQKRGIQIARTLAGQCIEPILFEDRYALFEIVNTYIRESAADESSDPLLLYVVIFDRSGNRLVSLNRTQTPTLEDRAPVIKAGTNPMVRAFSQMGHPMLEILYPIELQGYRVGHARLGLSMNSVQHTVKDLRDKVIFYIAVIVLGGILLGLWLAHRIISPIKVLTKGAMRLAQGHWGEQVRVNSKDEMGALASTLNTMSLKIAQTLEENRRAQENLLRTEKLNALGTLSAGLAHEIKNPLTSIKIIVQAMSKDPGDPGTMEEDLKVVLQQVEQVDKVLSRFLEFARPDPLRSEWTHLEQVISESMRLMDLHLRKYSIQVHLQIPDSLPLIKIDASKMKQALVNLMLNAVEAMPKGGDLWIRAEKLNKGVSIEVEDSGKGVPPKLSQHIFDPFVTTKPGGTGLGLPVAHTIITDHGGTLELVQRAGRGALFRIFLPAGGRHGDHSGGR